MRRPASKPRVQRPARRAAQEAGVEPDRLRYACGMRLTSTARSALACCLCLPLAVALADPLPACRYGDLPAPNWDEEASHLALVDTQYRLPADYLPGDLIPVRAAGLDDDRTLRAAVVTDLADLVSAAAAVGVEFELQSAFRSYRYQERVFAGWVESLGREEALRTSARPGHSEHQLGTALDLRSAAGPAPWLVDDWALTPEGAWLSENAWRFGFIMSYPRSREAESCYAYEPWHYRWFGRDIAARIQASGLSAREWLWRRHRESGG